MRYSLIPLLGGAILLAFNSTSFANDCASIENDIERLNCYDSANQSYTYDGNTSGSLAQIFSHKEAKVENLMAVNPSGCSMEYYRQSMDDGSLTKWMIALSNLDANSIEKHNTSNPYYEGRLVKISSKRGTLIDKVALNAQGQVTKNEPERTTILVVAEKEDVPEAVGLLKAFAQHCQR